jgi:hypothetical protein
MISYKSCGDPYMLTVAVQHWFAGGCAQDLPLVVWIATSAMIMPNGCDTSANPNGVPLVRETNSITTMGRGATKECC